MLHVADWCTRKYTILIIMIIMACSKYAMHMLHFQALV